MSKLLVNITSEGNSGRIEIVGAIAEWNSNNATDLRQRCNQLKASGVTDCNVYLMTTGGDCLQANEIVNILNESFGKYNAEGGALVASAGTYIAVCAETFVLAKNGQMMIHKPSTLADGNETDIESKLSLLKNITADYLAKYNAKLKKSKADFLAKWNAGDFWLTATEAVEWGFADAIKEPQKLDAKTENFINAMVANTSQNPNNEMKKELIELLQLDGVTAASTDSEVIEKVKAMLTQKQNTEKEETEQSVNALISQAQEEGKIITPQMIEIYKKIGMTSGVSALSEVLAAVPKPVSILGLIKKESKTGVQATTTKCRSKWTLDDYRKNDPKAFEKNPKLFDELYNKEHQND